MSERDGHDQPCYYCQKPCNGLAANPGVWPVALCHADDPGKVKWHHEACVNERLREAERYKAALEYYAAIEKQYAIGPRVATDALDHTAAMTAFNNTKDKYGSAMAELSDTALHPTAPTGASTRDSVSQPAEGRAK